MPKLTAKQEAFCQEYMVDLNATQAAIRAGYSKKTAQEISSQNLSKVLVAQRVAELFQERVERTQVKADDVIGELKLLGFSNMEDYMQTQDDGTAYADLSNLTRDQAAAIQELQTEEVSRGRGEGAVPITKIKFKLADKRSALELLGKHLGIFRDGTSVSGDLLIRVVMVKPDGDS